MPQADKTPGPDKTLIQKNWADNVMPQSFLRWREDEAQVLYDLTYQENIVDFCCGDAKILKTIKHQVRSYLGVDYDETSIVSAQKEAAGFNNIMFSPPVDYKAFIDHHLLDYLTDGQTYFGLSIGNAIGPLNKPSVFHVLNKASKMDKFFLSTLKKGNLDLRIEYYNNIGDSYDIDYDNEIIYSKTWGGNLLLFPLMSLMTLPMS